MSRPSVFDALERRGFVAQCTDASLRDALAERQFTVYVGFDPTSDSLHLGHLVPIMALSHFQRAGHRVLIIVGGATGMVGDPSGRSDERNLLGPDAVAANVRAVMGQFSKFLRFEGDNPATILDNNDWISRMSFIDWLRDVGKHFTVNYMLAKESVSERLKSSQGISFTEFSYMTMQAFDYLHLFDTYGCRLQCGGSDQWGNIVAGMDLIRKVRQGSTFGLTFPLVTTSSGEKFGKTAGNAVWLDRSRTPPWDLYQYLVRQDDRDVVRFLKLYTFLDLDEIAELERAIESSPEDRAAQRALAREVTAVVHGEAVASEVAKASEIVYGARINDVSDAVLVAAFAEVPVTQLSRDTLRQGLSIVDALITTGLTKSRAEATRLLRAGGVYVNNVRVNESARVTLEDLASPTFIVLRTGKRTYHMLRAS